MTRKTWQMPLPASRKGSRHAQFNHRIPVDVMARAVGVPVVLVLPASGSQRAIHVTAVHGRTHIRFSLGTSDRAVAAMRQALALVHMETVWEAIRSGPIALDFMQTVELSGEVYSKFIADHHREPGGQERWAAVKALNRIVREGRDVPGLTLPVLSSGNVAAQVAAAAELVKDRAGTLTSTINAYSPSASGPSGARLEDRFGQLAFCPTSAPVRQFQPLEQRRISGSS